MTQSTENTKLATMILNDPNHKLTAGEQKKWAAQALAKTREALKSKSVNNIVFKDEEGNKKA